MTTNRIIELLGEIRAEYNCFDEDEREKYEVLSKAIQKFKPREYTKLIPCVCGSKRRHIWYHPAKGGLINREMATMSDEAQRYYSKMPENRKKELRRMCRLSALMEENGAAKSEIDRVTMYISYVAQLRNRTYLPMRHEYGIDVLMTKYYDKYYKVSEQDVALYTYLIAELTGGPKHGEQVYKR